MQKDQLVELIVFAAEMAKLAVRAVTEIQKDLQGDETAKPLAQLLDETDSKWKSVIENARAAGGQIPPEST